MKEEEMMMKKIMKKLIQAEKLEDEEEEEEEEEAPIQDTKTPSRRVQTNHLESLILGNKNVGVETRRMLGGSLEQANISLLSIIETKTFAEANKDEGCLKVMNEELDQIEKNQTWEP